MLNGGMAKNKKDEVMKQYTNESQTAKLIELGFEKPKHTFTFKIIEYNDVKTDIDIPVSNYSIGELIEMLPEHIFSDGVCFDLRIYTNQYLWVVQYSAFCYEAFCFFQSKELIDALYDTIIKLKEEQAI